MLDRKKTHQERPLGLFRSPTNLDEDDTIPYEDDEEHGSSHHTGSAEITRTKSDVAPIPTATEQAGSESSKHIQHAHRRRSSSRHTGPSFRRHPEATPSELFYDLFFVANLATFTTQNEVVNGKGLSNYVGYFSIIWFTWFQVAMFDVRFSRDCVFDRLCKVLQFAVMVGFAFIAFAFDPAGATNGQVDGKSLSLLLMVSRLTLGFQYLAVWVCLRHWPDKFIAMGLMVACCFITAIAFLGVSFHFTTLGDTVPGGIAYCSWYVISGVEAVVHIVIACWYRYFSFKGTHLVERMGLMTLIVLGEGILGLSSAACNVWNNTNYYPGLGAAISSTLLVIEYFMYQLYFDTLADGHFGTIRQQIWALLHFPLHLSFVLFDEGTKQFIIWNTAARQVNQLVNYFQAIPLFAQEFGGITSIDDSAITAAQNNTEFFEEAGNQFYAAFYNFTTQPSYIYYPTTFNMTLIDESIETIKNGTTKSSLEFNTAIYELIISTVNSIFESFKIEGAEPSEEITKEGGVEAEFAQAMNDLNLFNLVLTYFYVATGVALLCILSLWLISKRSRHSWFDYVRIGIWVAGSLTIAFLGLLKISADQFNDPGETFVMSDWVLPTPMIILFVILLVYHLPIGQH